MQRLTPEQQRKAQISETMQNPATADLSQWSIVDQRHLGGTSQVNRVIPYEAVPATSLSQSLQDHLISIVAVFQELLPSEPLAHRLRLVHQYLSETHFCWIGGFNDDDPFYYRIQSPVVLVEYDCHSGIYLSNMEPDKYHIHSLHRLPNGGDYAQELIRQWRSKKCR
jgi:hypothetical protein